MKKPVGMLGMLTEILLMTFVKSFQWYVDWNPFKPFYLHFWGYIQIFGVQCTPLTLHLGVQWKLTAFSPRKVVHHADFCKYYGITNKIWQVIYNITKKMVGQTQRPWVRENPTSCLIQCQTVKKGFRQLCVIFTSLLYRTECKISYI
jgi:hypothetical protein